MYVFSDFGHVLSAKRADKPSRFVCRCEKKCHWQVSRGTRHPVLYATTAFIIQNDNPWRVVLTFPEITCRIKRRSPSRDDTTIVASVDDAIYRGRDGRIPFVDSEQSVLYSRNRFVLRFVGHQLFRRTFFLYTRTFPVENYRLPWLIKMQKKNCQITVIVRTFARVQPFFFHCISISFMYLFF